MAQEYKLGPDSQRQPGVPQGKVTKYTWTSKVYPGTTRDYWVYVPAQYKPDTPAATMVFQDGAGYVSEDGSWRVPIVFDNLIQRGEMPVTIAVLINPGVLPSLSPNDPPRANRSLEYDTITDRYSRLVLDEILPEVAKSYNLSSDPDLRAIGGSSSGAICAFTVAWQRPDAFHRVLSFIGSYTNLRGGMIYPYLIRATEPKPIRVFLQDGSNDLNIFAGGWFLANQNMVVGARIRRLRRHPRVGHRKAQQPSRRLDSARGAALAVAWLSRPHRKAQGRRRRAAVVGAAAPTRYRLGVGRRGLQVHRRPGGRQARQRILHRYPQ